MRRTARPLRAVAFALARACVPRISRPRSATFCFVGSVTVQVTVVRVRPLLRAVVTLQVARAAARCDCCEPPPTPAPGCGATVVPPPEAGALGAAGAAGVAPPPCGAPSD